MRYREPYVLYTRQNKHAIVWYYYIYDERGRRIDRSTGVGFKREKDRAKTKRQVKARLDELYYRGKLGSNPDALTLSQWVDDHSFWNWKRSTYVRGVIARSEKGRPGLTENYVNDGRFVWTTRIEPFHGRKFIDEITPADCEALLFQWVAEGVRHKTANNYRSYYSTMMSEAARLGTIPVNPWDRVPQFKAESKARGGITVAEGARIMAPDGLDLSNHRTRVYYLATKTAFLAGLRIGEVCGLLTDDLRSKSIERDGTTITMHYLDVSHQYHPKLGRRVPVKDKDARAVPVTPGLAAELEPFMTGQGRYLFSFQDRQSRPITANRLREWLYRRMVAVGISDEERAERNLSFHSARRFFNTLLRRSVSGDVLRKMTGHDSDEMTEHYTDYLPEDLLAITEAQGRLTSEQP